MNTETKNNNEPERAPVEKSAPTLAELQVQTTLAINRLQHLENALGEITHLKRSVYDLTDSRAKVARHAVKLAEALRAFIKSTTVDGQPYCIFPSCGVLAQIESALADYEGSAR